jgi:predicted GNAT family N-acyltransferase
MWLGGFGLNMDEGLTLQVALPGISLPEAYFTCRYATLRQPLGFPAGAEKLENDAAAIHAWWQKESGEVVAVGRIHLIPKNSDGSTADHAGPGAAVCPAFTPLTAVVADSATNLRPAVQIRQMGTLNEWRRQGLAAGLVCALEGAAISHWDAKTGWLQARLDAVALYNSEGWIIIDDEYEINGIGPHRSMWKDLAVSEDDE